MDSRWEEQPMVRGRLGAAVNDFRRLWHAGTVSGLSDAQLLAQFAANRDEAAFDSLMARHGPLVWSACLGGLVSTSVPAACRGATAQAALAVASKGWTAAGPTASALTLARRVHRAMVWTGLRSVFLLAISLAAVTWVSLAGIRIQTSQPPRGAEAGRSPVLPPAPVNHAEQEQPAPVSSAQTGD